jgi:hypothetical protein
MVRLRRRRLNRRTRPLGHLPAEVFRPGTLHPVFRPSLHLDMVPRLVLPVVAMALLPAAATVHLRGLHPVAGVTDLPAEAMVRPVAVMDLPAEVMVRLGEAMGLRAAVTVPVAMVRRVVTVPALRPVGLLLAGSHRRPALAALREAGRPPKPFRSVGTRS